MRSALARKIDLDAAQLYRRVRKADHSLLHLGYLFAEQLPGTVTGAVVEGELSTYLLPLQVFHDLSINIAPPVQSYTGHIAGSQPPTDTSSNYQADLQRPD